MALRQKLIELDPKATHKNYHYSPQIKTIIKSTLNQQIKQHQSSYSPQRTLITRTKKLLDYNTISMNKTTQRWSYSGDSKRGYTSKLKSRRDGKLNDTKRQLQLLNQFYKSNNKTQIKRYQDQIEQQQNQIHTVVAQYRLKRKWNQQKTNKIKTKDQNQDTLNPENKTITKQSTPEPKFERTKKNDLEQFDLDVFFDRMHPYRRLLISRRKSKGKVEPWTASINV